MNSFSRSSNGSPVDTEIEVLDERLKVFVTMSDSWLKTIVEVLGRKDSSRTLVKETLVKNYELPNGLLYEKIGVDPKKKTVGRTKLNQNEYNCTSSWFGWSLCRGPYGWKIRKRYYFPRKRSKCSSECVLTKIPQGRQPGKLQSFEPGKRLSEVINLDHVGSFVQSVCVKIFWYTAYRKKWKVTVKLHLLPRVLRNSAGNCWTSDTL